MSTLRLRHSAACVAACILAMAFLFENIAGAQSAACPALAQTLARGARDASTRGEVSVLQTFLATNPDVYPEALVTGFFGPATERAVQRYQILRGILSGGSSQTNGYGVVGPRTRAAIEGECARTRQATPASALPVDPTRPASSPSREALPDPQCSMSVAPSRVAPGERAVISWASTHADGAAMEGVGRIPVSGSRIVTPQQATRYVVRFANAAGEVASCSIAVAIGASQVAPIPAPLVSATTTSSITSGAPTSSSPALQSTAAPSCTIAATPFLLRPGESTTLAWVSINAENGTISGIGSVPPTGTRSVAPGASASYTATFTTQYGSATCTAHVTVLGTAAATSSIVGGSGFDLSPPMPTVGGTECTNGTATYMRCASGTACVADPGWMACVSGIWVKAPSIGQGCFDGFKTIAHRQSGMAAWCPEYVEGSTTCSQALLFCNDGNLFPVLNAP